MSLWVVVQRLGDGEIAFAGDRKDAWVGESGFLTLRCAPTGPGQLRPMTRLIGRRAARELFEDRAGSVAGEDVNGVTPETVGDVARHVFFRGVGVPVEDSFIMAWCSC